MPHREGFACAGSWLMEQVKTVTHYPREDEHAAILHEQQRPGGSAYEMLSALRALNADLPLYALGMLGEDEAGREILSACHKQEVDTFQLQTNEAAPTAHAVVVQAQTNDSRTSFYFPGANNLLSAEHFDFRYCLASWFHLSDCHLLEGLPQQDEAFGTVAGSVLQAARTAGLVTALTLTTCEKTAEVMPMLQALDYLIINERVLETLTGGSLRAEQLSLDNIRAAAASLLRDGAQSGLAIIFAEGAFASLCSGESAWLPFSQEMSANPRSAAAFSAGFLYSRYSGRMLEQCLSV